MKIAICSHCCKEFEVSDNRYAVWKSRQNKIFCSDSCRKEGLGCYSHKKIRCLECDKEFFPKERTSKFCSSSCAAKYNNKRRVRKKKVNPLNKRNNSLEKKVKKLQKLNEKYKAPKKIKIYICKNCGKSFESNRKKLSCSPECAMILKNAGARKGGLKSAEVQSKERRSKNEKLFAELCKKDFENVLTNEPMFNGWDADVILLNEKIAVLWNGKWHYEEIKKKGSLKQIQNRDKIKMSEIIKAGYKPYIIKDMGKHNPAFVKEEYEKFKSQWRF